MITITPPHTFALNFEKLGIKNIPQVNPKSMNFTRFMRYIETQEYPEKIVDEIYRKILNDPENGKEQLRKLVFDIVVFSGIAHDLDFLINVYRAEGCIDDGTMNEIDETLWAVLYTAQLTKQRRVRRKKKSILSLFGIGLDALRPKEEPEINQK